MHASIGLEFVFFGSSTCQLYRNDGIHRHRPPDVPPMVAGSPMTYHNLLVPSVTLSWVPPNKGSNKKMNRTNLLVGVYYRSESVDLFVAKYVLFESICCSGALHVNPLQQKEPILDGSLFPRSTVLL